MNTRFRAGARRSPAAAAAICCVVAVLVSGCDHVPGLRSAAKGSIYGPLYQTAIASEQNRDYLGAAGQYDKLVHHNPGNLDLLLGLARNLRYAGHAHEAVAVLEKHTGKYGDRPRFGLELGKAKIAAGEPTRAIDQLEALAIKAPKNWQVYSALGIAYDLTEKFDKAQAAYDKALALSKDNPAVLNNKAISLASSGDLGGAIKVLTSASVTARRSPELRQTLALLYGLKGDSVRSKGLAKIDLPQEAIDNNQEVYARIRE